VSALGPVYDLSLVYVDLKLDKDDMVLDRSLTEKQLQQWLPPS
jgi:hypothetical protein